MELAKIVLDQVIIMFLLMGVGFLASKLRIINLESNKQITNFLLYFVVPTVTINAFQTPYEPQKLRLLGIAFVLAVASHVIAIIISLILVRGNKVNIGIERFAVVYTNCGFMALPLLGATFGNEGILFGSVYMVVFQILSWTHGYIGISGKVSKKELAKAFTAPVMFAVVIGFTLFLASISLPYVVFQTTTYIGSLNTPLAMVVIGVNLAQSKLFNAFKTLKVYYIVFVTNFLVPIVVILTFSMLKTVPTNLILINVISVSCPCAAAGVMFAQKMDKDAAYAGQILTLSNIVSIASIPLIMLIAQAFIK